MVKNHAGTAYIQKGPLSIQEEESRMWRVSNGFGNLDGRDGCSTKTLPETHRRPGGTTVLPAGAALHPDRQPNWQRQDGHGTAHRQGDAGPEGRPRWLGGH